MILFVLFFIIPVAQSFWLSFTNSYGMKQEYDFIWFDNYKEAFTDKTFTQTIANTLSYTLIAVIAGNLVSIILAFLLDSKLKAKNFFRTIFFIPNTMSLLVVGYIWYFVYTKVLPEITKAISGQSVALLGNKSLVILALAIVGIWNVAGYYMVIYIAGLQSISEDLIEAAEIDGAGTWKTIWYIKLPILAPTIMTCLILSVAAHMKVFELPYTMTSGGPVGASSTMVYKIYTTAFGAGRNGYASAQSIILFLIIASISLVLNAVMKKKEEQLS
ncbi:sugar ABC transporter permease [Suilimivivens sp.]|uniref:carbohydrate ABC transporter permease n=1 Tax=Suilimivivens sp. TaxID=2981669 RepID=UPI00307C38DA